MKRTSTHAGVGKKKKTEPAQPPTTSECAPDRSTVSRRRRPIAPSGEKAGALDPVGPLDATVRTHGGVKLLRPNVTDVYGRYLTGLAQRSPLRVAILSGLPADRPETLEWIALCAEALPTARIHTASPDISRSLPTELCSFVRINSGDQAELERWAETKGPFDLVIDDGTQKGPQIVAAFFILLHHIVAGGYYVLEDAQHSYWPQFGGSSLAPDLFETPMRWIKQFCDIVQSGDFLTPNNIGALTGFPIIGVHVHPRVCFVECGQATTSLDETTRQEWAALERIKAKELASLWMRFNTEQDFRLNSTEFLNLLRKISL